MQNNDGNTSSLIKKLANLLNKGDPESSELLSVLDEIRVQGFSKNTSIKDNPKCSVFSHAKDSQLSDLESSCTCLLLLTNRFTE